MVNAMDTSISRFRGSIDQGSPFRHLEHRPSRVLQCGGVVEIDQRTLNFTSLSEAIIRAKGNEASATVGHLL